MRCLASILVVYSPCHCWSMETERIFWAALQVYFLGLTWFPSFTRIRAQLLDIYISVLSL